MNISSWVDNLAAYSLQIAAVVVLATLLSRLFSIKVPRVVLAYWQTLLLVCLLLPFFQPLHRTVIPLPSVPAARVSVSAPIVARNGDSVFTIPYRTIAVGLGVGVVLRLLWLLMGLARLGQYRRKARWVSAVPKAVLEAQSLVGVRADMYLSGEIDSPVTFGIRRPTILFPVSFAEMGPHLQRPIACHELLHIRRRDWGYILLEDVVAALFWFHPAIAWVLNRIRLSREQVVDREVVALMGEREPYLESLLRVAEMGGRRQGMVPAPLFLKERHLVQRVAFLLKEVRMSRSRVAFSLAAMAALILATCRLAVAWFPLSSLTVLVTAPRVDARATEKPMREPIRVGSNVQESKLISKIEPTLPEQARANRVSGMVIVQITINETGDVYEVTVLRGHPLLDQAAVDAVKQWKYSPTYLGGEPVPVTTSVAVSFARPSRQALVVDESGTLRDPVAQLSGEALLQRLGETRRSVTILVNPNLPLPTLNEVLRDLQKHGVQDLELQGGYVLQNGQPFYQFLNRLGRDLQPPQLALDNERLSAIARATGRIEEIPRAGNGSRVLLYYVHVNEVGEIVSIERLRGPKLDEVEAELARTRVLSPGRRGPNPEAMTVAVEVVAQK